jgi:hypothetical protein
MEHRTPERLPQRCARIFDRLRDRVETERLAVPALIVALVSVAGAGFTSAGPDADGRFLAPPPLAAVGAAATGDPVPAAAEEPEERVERLDPDRELVQRTAAATDLPTRRMSYERYAENARQMIANVPTLDQVRQNFPGSPMTRSVGAQKGRIHELNALVEVTVEGFDDLAIDRSRRKAFADLERYHEKIEPKMFIVHWTGMGYRDVDHFVTSLRPYRVQFFIDDEANVYDLFQTDRQKPAHALGVNDFAQGVEIETGHFDGRTSPLFSYTPDQIEQTIYLAVEFLRRNDLPVDETTILGHYAADLIFTNPYYDPLVSRFSRATLRKYDPPQELMNVIVHKAMELDEALDAR